MFSFEMLQDRVPDRQDLEAINRLNQLCLSQPDDMLWHKYVELLNWPNALCVVARNKEGVIVAKQWIYWYMLDYGVLKAWIEQVATHPDHEGRGLGTRIGKKLICLIKIKGIHEIHLTSSDAKQAAHRLYEKLGFRKRDTNNFIFELKKNT